MNNIAKQLEYLRNEIAARDSQLMAGVLLLAALIVASYIAAVASGKENLYKLPILLLIAGVFFVARQDYLEHRPVPWIEKAETALQESHEAEPSPEGFVNWETYHRNLKSRMLFLLPIDLLAAFAFFYIFYDCVRQVFKNEAAFVWWSGLGLAVAIASVFVGLWAADK